jgi:hypothetical protein
MVVSNCSISEFEVLVGNVVLGRDNLFALWVGGGSIRESRELLLGLVCFCGVMMEVVVGVALNIASKAGL